MSKRRRDDVDVDALVAKPEAACAVLLGIVSSWCDRCSARFDVEHKLTKTPELATLQLGFFDELSAVKVAELMDAELPGGFVVSDVTCDLSKETVVISIARSTRRDEARNVKPRVFVADATESMRLRIAYDVREGDADNVHEAVSSVMSEFGRASDVKISSVMPRPALYVVRVAVSSKVPLPAIRAIAKFKGTLDFDNQQVVLLVSKTHGDIG